MTVQIRTLQAEDRPLLEGILRSDETFRDDEVGVALELIDEALADSKSDYWFRIAEVEGVAAGYLCYGPTPMTDCTFDLYWIVTHAAHRGRRVARSLVEYMEKDLLERGPKAQVRVETSQSEGYGAARKFYDRLEYPEVARFKDFYKEGDDLIVFFKNL